MNDIDRLVYHEGEYHFFADHDAHDLRAWTPGEWNSSVIRGTAVAASW